MKLALCQIAMSDNENENLERQLSALRQAALHGADLIVYPELQLHRFFPQYEGRDVSDKLLTADHPIIRQFQDACRENRIMAAPNFYLREPSGCFDATLLIGGDGALLGRQKMVHIAQAAQFYEQDYYTPSDDGFLVFDTPHGKIGIVVCFDRHYPESIRTEALMGADLILIPTANTESEPMEMFDWEVKVQAFQSSVAVAMCNRTGTEGDMVFSGRSLVTDANGDTIAQAGSGEELLYADVDMAASAETPGPTPPSAARRCTDDCCYLKKFISLPNKKSCKISTPALR